MATKRNTRAGVEDRWHRAPRPGEVIPHYADTGTTAGSWCTDTQHGKPGTLVCTARHGTGRRWLARWVDRDGIERTQSFPRKADAQRHIDGIVTAIGTGTYTDPQRSAVTFGEVAEAWLAKKEAADRAPKTVANYRGLLDVLIYPKWKDEQLRTITYERLQTWVSWLATDPAARQHKKAGAGGLSASRVIQAHQVVHQVMAEAIRRKHIAVNPADNIELPSKKPRKQIALTHEQVRQLAEASGEAGPIVLFLAYSGLRIGECMALRVADVDVEARTVTVARSITYVRKLGNREGPTKTDRVRVVPILTSELADTVKRQVDGREPGEYLFPRENGDHMTIGWFNVRLERAKKKLGGVFASVTPHTFRHTAGSLAIDVGATVPEVQALLGHSNATTTMNVYSHKLGNFERLAQRMEAAVTATT